MSWKEWDTIEKVLMMHRPLLEIPNLALTPYTEPESCSLGSSFTLLIFRSLAVLAWSTVDKTDFFLLPYKPERSWCDWQGKLCMRILVNQMSSCHPSLPQAAGLCLENRSFPPHNSSLTSTNIEGLKLYCKTGWVVGSSIPWQFTL